MSDKHLDDVSRVISARAWKLNMGFDGRWNFPLYGLIGCIVGNAVYRVFPILETKSLDLSASADHSF